MFSQEDLGSLTGIDVGKELDLSALLSSIRVIRELTVEAIFTARSEGDRCTVTQPDAVIATVFVTPPSQPESAVLTITNQEVYLAVDCRGTHSRTKSINPLGTQRGIYTIRYKSLAYLSPPTRSSVSPAIRIAVDGREVVNVTYDTTGAPPISTPAGNIFVRSVNEQWDFVFEPTS